MAELLTVFFQILITNPLPVILVILGVLSVALAIIGKIPPIELAEDRARRLTRFGVGLISSGIILALLLAWVTARPVTVSSTPTSSSRMETVAPPTDTPAPATLTGTFTPSPTPTDLPASTSTPVTNTPAPSVTPSVAFTPLLSPTPFVYAREAELPDDATVGKQIVRTNASGQSVHGQFGTLDSAPFPPRSGCVSYTHLSLPPVEHLYIEILYSKDSASFVQIHIYIDGETIPRASFYPSDLGDWNTFAWTRAIDLGKVDGGIHSITFCTDGQQFGVADLDKFKLTTK